MSFMKRMQEFLVGTPVQLRDPAEIHVSQVGDEVYNATAPGATANCGPAAVLMVVRLLGLDVPGAERLRGEALIEHVRLIATGNANRHVGTTNVDLQRVLAKSGCAWRVLRDPRDMLRAVADGEPVIMAGNPTAPGCYTERFEYYDIRRWDGGHWIVVSRFNPEAKTFTVNDPQSVVGPVDATAAELIAFSSRDGDFGIAVRRA